MDREKCLKAGMFVGLYDYSKENRGRLKKILESLPQLIYRKVLVV